MADTDTIIHKRGDTYVLNCVYTDEDGNPIPLTGYTINSKARDEDGAVLFSVTNGSGITITDEANGEYTLQVEKEDTAAWTAEMTYTQDIEYVVGGIAKSTETFFLQVEPDVTY